MNVISNTSSLKIITIAVDDQLVREAKSSQIQKLEFHKLTKTQLIDYFKQLLKDARKFEDVRNVDL